MQYDFRSVYASLLKDWFCLPPTDVNAVMLDTFATLPVVQTACCVPPIISGAANACINGTSVYSVTATAGSTYLWVVTGGTIVAGQGSHQITVQWNNNVQGTVHVEQTTP
jgi:hypothetical protein